MRWPRRIETASQSRQIEFESVSAYARTRAFRELVLTGYMLLSGFFLKKKPPPT
jgi:hypothetical protein